MKTVKTQIVSTALEAKNFTNKLKNSKHAKKKHVQSSYSGDVRQFK